ncbi:hypothetical protein MM440_02885 [Arsenicicoccus piscis]|uniref:Uncharacterized protein n=1 Tax=Arsenicicoccus piscis TaxID=673954 RepID=A0ABQ6HTY7_9MICO|nr:hypothetical protein [Arsenicicoccus piscis]MCH8626754.1 hypothetical protein [Arsenicicoccus piscis]GMA21437.1 hypothetical protein GCM10025862_34580 [Arsenicicoccus piscis]
MVRDDAHIRVCHVREDGTTGELVARGWLARADLVVLAGGTAGSPALPLRVLVPGAPGEEPEELEVKTVHAGQGAAWTVFAVELWDPSHARPVDQAPAALLDQLRPHARNASLGVDSIDGGGDDPQQPQRAEGKPWWCQVWPKAPGCS